MTKWVMVVDLRKCIGCGTCKKVCGQSNQVPPGSQWRKIVEKTLTEPENERLFVTMGCMHCEKPPCLDVCPTKATRVGDDGIVTISEKHCMGCRTCIVACPYDARSIAETDNIINKESEQIGLNDKNSLLGTCTKCDFCKRIIEKGLSKGLQPGKDAEASPICVQYCISDALYFGDLDDPESEVSKLLASRKFVRMSEDSGTKPSVYYLVP